MTLAPGLALAQTPAQRHIAARTPNAARTRARMPRSDQPWRAFQRGFRLLRTNTLRPRRITTDPAFCFNALSEFLAFIVRGPFGPSILLMQLVEGATIFIRSKFRPDGDPCDQPRRSELERCAVNRDRDRFRANGCDLGCVKGGRAWFIWPCRWGHRPADPGSRSGTTPITTEPAPGRYT
jgi:hypothetical protein